MKQKDLLWCNSGKTGRLFWRLLRVLKALLCWRPPSGCSLGLLILPRKGYMLDLILASGGGAGRGRASMSLLVGPKRLLPYLFPAFSNNQWVFCHFISFLWREFDVLKFSPRQQLFLAIVKLYKMGKGEIVT